MKKTLLLNSEIAFLIASMGHHDFIVIADSGFPVAKDVKKIDLALTKGIPGFFETVQAVQSELCIEEAIIATEMKIHSPQILEPLKTILGSTELTFVSHEEFKHISRSSLAVIRTGEFTPYANVILKAGVVF